MTLATGVASLSRAGGWPDVPSCYGWLSLDRRGAWRLKGSPVSHPGLNAYLGNHYGVDETGNWLVRNGPQKVYVDLDYTPIVYRVASGSQLLTHTGQTAGPLQAVMFDETGCVLLVTSDGPGILDDRDLESFANGLTLADGRPADNQSLERAMQGAGAVFWDGFETAFIPSSEVAARFGFNPRPRP